jgi:hypothetical protein
LFPKVKTQQVDPIYPLKMRLRLAVDIHLPGKSLPDISNNVGPGKHFLKTLLSFHLKEFFSFVFFRFLLFPASTTTARL